MRYATSFAGAIPALFLVACGGGNGDSADVARLEAGHPLTARSAEGRALAHVDVEGGSVMEGNNAFVIHFEPESTELVGASGLMPVHGHGFSRAPSIEKTDAGYRVGNLVFYMSGLWHVHLDLTVENQHDEVEFSIDVP